MLVSFLALLQNDLGLGGATTVAVAQALQRGDSSEMRRTIATAHSLYSSFALIACAAYGLMVAAMLPSLNLPMELAESAQASVAMGALQLLLVFATSGHRQVLAGIGRLDVANIILVTGSLARIVLTLVVVRSGGGLEHIVLADTGAVALVAGLTWLTRRRLHPATNTSVFAGSLATARSLLVLNSALLVLSLAATVVLQVSNLIIASKASLTAVAIYGTGARLYQLAKEVTNSLTPSLLPFAAAQHAAKDVAGARTLLVNGTRAANILLYATALPMIVYAHDILRLWVGGNSRLDTGLLKSS